MGLVYIELIEFIAAYFGPDDGKMCYTQPKPLCESVRSINDWFFRTYKRELSINDGLIFGGCCVGVSAKAGTSTIRIPNVLSSGKREIVIPNAIVCKSYNHYERRDCIIPCTVIIPPNESLAFVNNLYRALHQSLLPSLADVILPKYDAGIIMFPTGDIFYTTKSPYYEIATPKDYSISIFVKQLARYKANIYPKIQNLRNDSLIKLLTENNRCDARESNAANKSDGNTDMTRTEFHEHMCQTYYPTISKGTSDDIVKNAKIKGIGTRKVGKTNAPTYPAATLIEAGEIYANDPNKGLRRRA